MSRKHLRAIGKVLTKADIILIILICFTAAIIFILNHTSSSDKTVYIYKDEQLIRSVPLTEEQLIIVVSEGIEIEIKSYKVRMLKSTCPHQTCVDQGWSYNLPIVCVPNKIILIIKGKDSDEKMLITS